MLAFTGVGLLATVPVQTSLLADAFPVRARPDVFAAYVAMGATGFVRRAAARRVRASASSTGRASGGPRSSWLAVARGRARVRRRAASLMFVVAAPRWKRSSTTTATSATNRSPPLHALTRFRQIATLRYVTVGLLAMGFGFIGWGLWFNLWLEGHFQLGATDRALLLAAMALPALLLTPARRSRSTGRAFRRAPHRAVMLSAGLLVAFNLAIVGWWTHSVVATGVLGARRVRVRRRRDRVRSCRSRRP